MSKYQLNQICVQENSFSFIQHDEDLKNFNPIQTPVSKDKNDFRFSSPNSSRTKSIKKTPGTKFLYFKTQSPNLSPDQTSTMSPTLSQFQQILCINCQNFINAECIDIHSTYCIYSDPDEKAQQQNKQTNPQQVLCVNCQNYISSESIEKHSYQCTTVLQHVQTFELDNDQELYVNFKLQKLSEALQHLIEQRIVNFNIPMFLRTILTQCETLLNCNDFFEIQKEIVNINKVKLKIESEKNVDKIERTYLSIYLERIKILANEKQALFKSRASAESPVSFKNERNSFAENDQAIQINSVIQYTEENENNNNITSELSDDQSVINFQEQASCKQKNFLKLFMGLKISYGSDHPGQQLQAKNLFKIAMAKKVQESE